MIVPSGWDLSQKILLGIGDEGGQGGQGSDDWGKMRCEFMMSFESLRLTVES
ncbi:hypothetical protein NIES2100_31980 [Calothrix sp. NIES-2100]|uniref:hypothetical protein n=1 Tax=Calothrix sp. NIES-2100 TaxID=1954172 RepID=UPI000B600ACB|nr:hypothetical protein NIES2100_31980 [Calothrix sp. NIES-2100]